MPAGRHGAVAFGDPRVDAHLPPGGLALGALHEVTAEGIEAETGALGAAFAAVLLARLLTRDRGGAAGDLDRPPRRPLPARPRRLRSRSGAAAAGAEPAATR